MAGIAEIKSVECNNCNPILYAELEPNING